MCCCWTGSKAWLCYFVSVTLNLCFLTFSIEMTTIKIDEFMFVKVENTAWHIVRAGEG